MKKIIVLLLCTYNISAVFVRPTSVGRGQREFNKLIESGDKAGAINYFDNDFYPIIQKNSKSLGDALEPFFDQFYNMPYGGIPDDKTSLKDIVYKLDNRSTQQSPPPPPVNKEDSEYADILRKFLKSNNKGKVDLTPAEIEQLMNDWKTESKESKAAKERLGQELAELIKKSSQKGSGGTSQTVEGWLKTVDLSQYNDKQQALIVKAAMAKAQEDKKNENPIISSSDVVQDVNDAIKGNIPTPPPLPPLPGGNIPVPPPLPPDFLRNGNTTIPDKPADVVTAPTLQETRTEIQSLITLLQVATRKSQQESAAKQDMQLPLQLNNLQNKVVKPYNALKTKQLNNETLSDAEKKWLERMDLVMPSIRLLQLSNDMTKAPADFVKILEMVDPTSKSVKAWHESVQAMVDVTMKIKQLEKDLQDIKKQQITAQEVADVSQLKKLKKENEDKQKEIKAAQADLKKLQGKQDAANAPLVDAWKEYLQKLEAEVLVGDRSGTDNLKGQYKQGQDSYAQLTTALNDLLAQVDKQFMKAKNPYGSWQIKLIKKYKADNNIDVLTDEQRNKIITGSKDYPYYEGLFNECLTYVQGQMNTEVIQESIIKKQLLDKVQEKVIPMLYNVLYGIMTWHLYLAIQPKGTLSDSHGWDHAQSLGVIKSLMKQADFTPTFVVDNAGKAPSIMKKGAPEMVTFVHMLPWYNTFITDYCSLAREEKPADDDTDVNDNDGLAARAAMMLKQYKNEYVGVAEVIATYKKIPGKIYEFAQTILDPMQTIGANTDIFLEFDDSGKNLIEKEMLDQKMVLTFKGELGFALGFYCKKIKIDGPVYIEYIKNSQDNYRITMLAPRVLNPKTDILVTTQKESKRKLLINPTLITPADVNDPKVSLASLAIMAWRLDLKNNYGIVVDVMKYFASNYNKADTKKDKEFLKELILAELAKREKEATDKDVYEYALYLLYDKGVSPTNDFCEKKYAELVKKVSPDILSTGDADEVILNEDEIDYIAKQFIKTMKEDEIKSIHVNLVHASLFKPSTSVHGSIMGLGLDNIVSRNKYGIVSRTISKDRIVKFVAQELGRDEKEKFVRSGPVGQHKVIEQMYEKLTDLLSNYSGSTKNSDPNSLDGPDTGGTIDLGEVD